MGAGGRNSPTDALAETSLSEARMTRRRSIAIVELRGRRAIISDKETEFGSNATSTQASSTGGE
ncbi:hypothetical protein [Roseitranquillus sediminis]|uniref:hypothetical protein n=1 Tax=Roseitranquillus sediminis TaxID=2809051 RepID=UPI001D0BFB9B|nr:hypothetical protein [Roseitranquillus sediminis]